MPDFYDWNKTLSYDAPITMVCGARGIGKTYGLRLQFIRDYLKNGWRFVEISRYKNQVSGIAANYFDRIRENSEFDGLDFKTQGRYAYVSRETDEKGKPIWELCGYFVALSEHQDIKKLTFSRVKRLVLDEFILDRTDVYKRYLKDEWGKLTSIVDTASRQRADVKGIEPRVYLLGNALNIVNPYFAPLGIRDIPKKGFSWHAKKFALLHYADDVEYSERKAKETVAGVMYGISGQFSANVNNDFLISNRDYIKDKPKRAHFSYGIVYKGQRYGVWADSSTLKFYINTKIPNNAEPVFAISAEDKTINYRMARKSEKRLTSLAELFIEGAVFFDCEATRNAIFDVFALYGVRIN